MASDYWNRVGADELTQSHQEKLVWIDLNGRAHWKIEHWRACESKPAVEEESGWMVVAIDAVHIVP
jgi:hypothetical protein